LPAINPDGKRLEANINGNEIIREVVVVGIQWKEGEGCSRGTI